MTPQTTSEDNTRYAHIPINFGEDEVGHVTLAFEVNGETLNYGAAFCSPTDNFSRPKGRLIAKGRKSSVKRSRSLAVTPGSEDLVEQMIADIENGNYSMPEYRKANGVNTPLWYFNGTK